mmetsp:Transcript_73066/g.136522  ORF Transcript_73066/g.136522 Transcript_73066/m.136522 type:complete len:412 (-) Transcript_73066:38-1273(-)
MMESHVLSLADFDTEKHANFFHAHVKSLSKHYAAMDNNRLTLLYFALSGLDLLGRLDEVDKGRMIRFIYSLQSPLTDHGGFYGYPPVKFPTLDMDKCNNQPHIANTYTALVMLIMLGDSLDGVNREAVACSLKKWQLDDGSFCCVQGFTDVDSESDMRFVYCAAAICYILNLWDAIDVAKMEDFILSSRSYDKAFGMGPDCESHGGCTYCAVAALAMANRLNALPDRKALIDWCTKRQQRGFQGRIEKAMDTCYSFWVGGSLHLLGAGPCLAKHDCAVFLHMCEDTVHGGFKKFPESAGPDLLHSYFSVCGLCLCGLLPQMNCLLNMSQRAFHRVAGTVATGPRRSAGMATAQQLPAFPPEAGQRDTPAEATAGKHTAPPELKNWQIFFCLAALVAALAVAWPWLQALTSD